MINMAIWVIDGVFGLAAAVLVIGALLMQRLSTAPWLIRLAMSSGAAGLLFQVWLFVHPDDPAPWWLLKDVALLLFIGHALHSRCWDSRHGQNTPPH